MSLLRFLFKQSLSIGNDSRRAILVSLFIVAGFLSFSSFAADAVRRDEQNERPQIVFRVDGETWTPPREVSEALSNARVDELPEIIIEQLFDKLQLQNIVVSEVSSDNGRYLEVRADRMPKVGEVSFKGLTATQTQQLRTAIKTRVGFPFISEEADRDRRLIERKLFDRGYRGAKVGAPQREIGINGELKIVFPVELQTPCRIAEIITEPDDSVFDYFNTPIELGSLCDRSALEEILERQRSRLLSDGYFSSEIELLAMDVAPDQQRGSVRIRFVRGAKTRVEVVNRQTGAVTDVLAEYGEKISVFDILSLSDEELRADVRRIFVNRGFSSAVVTGPTRLTEPTGDSVVRFFVQTGPIVYIGDVRFVGELPLPKQEILQRLELVPGIFGGAVPFVEDALPRYRERLSAIYLEEGYADARVSEPVVNYVQDGRAVTITIEVRSGLRSVLRDVTILGRPFDFSLSRNFQERILQPGQPVNAQKLKNLEDQVRLELMSSGYAYATTQVLTKSLPAVGEIRPIQVTVDLNPGPLVRVGRVYAEGDSFGKQDRIIAESGLRTGDIFTPDALEQARSRILKHDLFDSVLIEPFSSEAIERREAVLDLVIRLSAKKSYSLGLSPSYGTRSGYRFNVDFAKNNLTSAGLRFTSAVTLSQEKLQSSVLSNQRIMGRKLTIGLMEPLLRLGDYVTPLDWSALTGVELSAQSLSDRYFETAETGFTWRPLLFDRNWSFQTKIVHEWSKAIGQDVKPLEALERPTVKIREFTLSGSVDTRDNPEWPTGGLTLDITSNHARFGLASDVKYDRYSIDSGFFFPVFRRLSGALNFGGLKISDVVNAQAEAVTAPSSRRATLAGRAIVRGFPEASSFATPGPLLWLNLEPPQANPDLVCLPTIKPIGATNVLYAKAEFRVRSPWFDESLGFAGFLDSGTAFFTGTEQQLLQERLDGGLVGLDPGATDQCALRSARVIGDSPTQSLNRDFFKNYYQNSYLSTGLGLRYIISNFASVNIDVGFPLREPGDASRDPNCVSPAEVGNRADAPACVKRSSTSKLFGLFPVPGAYHFGIGANF